MKFSEEDKKFVKSQLTGQTIIKDGVKFKIKSVIAEYENEVTLIFGRMSRMSIDNQMAMELAEKGKTTYGDGDEVNDIIIEGFEIKEESEEYSHENKIIDLIKLTQADFFEGDDEIEISLRAEETELGSLQIIPSLVKDGEATEDERYKNYKIFATPFWEDENSLSMEINDDLGNVIFTKKSEIPSMQTLESNYGDDDPYMNYKHWYYDEVFMFLQDFQKSENGGDEEVFMPKEFKKDEKTPPQIAKENYSKLTNEELVTAYNKHLQSWDGEESYHQMEIQIMEELLMERGLKHEIAENVSNENNFVESVILALHHNKDKNGSDVDVLMILKPLGITLDDWYDIKTQNYSFLKRYNNEQVNSMVEALNDYVEGFHEEDKELTKEDYITIGHALKYKLDSYKEEVDEDLISYNKKLYKKIQKILKSF